MILAEFHWLRPLWLLALLPLGVLVWWLLRDRTTRSNWMRVVDAHLLPSLVVEPTTRAPRMPIILLGIAWLLTILALAGPTWSQLPQPVYRLDTAQVLILDLSRSMDATDLEPSRLIRARFKTMDLLERTREGQTGLIVFAGDAHVVSPLTDDAETIAALIPALSTDIVPLQGSRPDIALREADTLLQQAARAGGEIVVVTDGMGAEDAALQAARTLRNNGRRVSVLAVGTEAGTPIPTGNGNFLEDASGAIVLPRLDTAALRRLAEAGGGTYHRITADDRDLEAMLHARSEPARTQGRRAGERSTDLWRDEGPWLVLLLLPLAALAFRRGWLAVLVVVPLLPPPAHAVDWADLWLRPDQRGAQALRQQKPAEAAKLFQDPQWQGTAYYRAGEYEKALQAFEHDDTSQGHYNRGNALAKLGQLPRALQAYEQALELDAELEDAAFNRDFIRRMMQEQQSKSSSGGEPQSDGDQQQSQSQSQTQSQSQAQSQTDQTADSGQEHSPGDRTENGAEQARPGQSAGQTAEREPSAAGETEDQVPAQSAQDTAQQSPSTNGSWPEEVRADRGQPLGSAETNAENSESRQALEQWLRRIPDDPGGLLREKFRREHLRRGARTRIAGDPW